MTIWLLFFVKLALQVWLQWKWCTSIPLLRYLAEMSRGRYIWVNESKYTEYHELSSCQVHKLFSLMSWWTLTAIIICSSNEHMRCIESNHFPQHNIQQLCTPLALLLWVILLLLRIILILLIILIILLRSSTIFIILSFLPRWWWWWWWIFILHLGSVIVVIGFVDISISGCGFAYIIPKQFEVQWVNGDKIFCKRKTPAKESIHKLL